MGGEQYDVSHPFFLLLFESILRMMRFTLR